MQEMWRKIEEVDDNKTSMAFGKFTNVFHNSYINDSLHKKIFFNPHKILCKKICR